MNPDRFKTLIKVAKTHKIKSLELYKDLVDRTHNKYLKELVKEKGELFSQNRYDFDPKILDKEDIKEIKGLVKEKRVDYGIAPIGTDIFSFIRQKEPNGLGQFWAASKSASSTRLASRPNSPLAASRMALTFFSV